MPDDVRPDHDGHRTPVPRDRDLLAVGNPVQNLRKSRTSLTDGHHSHTRMVHQCTNITRECSEDVQASAVSDEGGIAVCRQGADPGKSSIVNTRAASATRRAGTGQDTVTVTPASRVMESIAAVACTTALALGA